MSSGPSIELLHPGCLLVISTSGKMNQLFTPFRVQVLVNTPTLVKGCWVFVEQVRPHPKCRIVYLIFGEWWPYFLFRIKDPF